MEYDLSKLTSLMDELRDKCHNYFIEYQISHQKFIKLYEAIIIIYQFYKELDQDNTVIFKEFKLFNSKQIKTLLQQQKEKMNEIELLKQNMDQFKN